MRGAIRAFAVVAAALVLGYGMVATRDSGYTTWLAVLAVAFVLLLVAVWPRVPHGAPRFERAVIRCTAVVVVAFIMVSIQLVYMQVVNSGEILAREATTASGDVVMNPRQRVNTERAVRGRIFASNGEAIVGTEVGPNGSWSRTYGDPAATYVAGFYSPLLYGLSNLEATYNDYLTGEKGGNPFSEWMDGILHRTRRGYDLTLSLDLDLQKQADQLLGDRRGSVVVMDARTGAVVALVSKPHVDPSKLYASAGPGQAEQMAQARAYWEELAALPPDEAPLLMRPTQWTDTPGSVFKTVVASAALETGVAKPDTVYRDEGALTVGARVIQEENRPDPNRVNYTLTESYGYSLNVVFAQIGQQLGPDRLLQYATKFGFGQAIPFDLPTTPSQVAGDDSALSDNALLAVTAFGQGQILATPLQMALVADAVANNGEMMRPYLVQRVSTFEGKTLQERQPEVWKRAISEETAAQMRDIMVQSVEQGYARDAQIPGYVVGGKTGTAETGGGDPHAWFIGFAGKDQPEYVVAVMVEHGGEGSKVALPIGRDMLKAALERARP